MLLAGYFVWLRISAKTGGICINLASCLGPDKLEKGQLASTTGTEIKADTNDNQPRAKMVNLEPRQLGPPL